MASRKDQKEQARAARLAAEQKAAAAAARARRLQIFGGAVAVAVVVIVVAIVVSSGGNGGSGATASTNPHSAVNTAASKRVNTLLAGINQTPGSSIVMGNSNAKVTITEFGDLECSVCDEFDLAPGVKTPDADQEGYAGTGILDSVIAKDVRSGKAKLVYKSLETATSSGASPSMWTAQQSAANAAALQGKGWNYVELFYNEQGYEKAHYVTDAFLEGLAHQIKGLNYQQWYKAWKSNPTVKSVLASQNTEGTQLDVANESNVPADQRGASTPTLWVKGAKSQAAFIGITAKSAAGEVAQIQKAVNAAA